MLLYIATCSFLHFDKISEGNPINAPSILLSKIIKYYGYNKIYGYTVCDNNIIVLHSVVFIKLVTSW